MVTFPQAALGADVSIPTLEGPTTVKIHPGTQAGRSFDVKGKGMPRFRAYGKGDLHRASQHFGAGETDQPATIAIEQLAKEFGTEVQKHRFFKHVDFLTLFLAENFVAAKFIVTKILLVYRFFAEFDCYEV